MNDGNATCCSQWGSHVAQDTKDRVHRLVAPTTTEIVSFPSNPSGMKYAKLD